MLPPALTCREYNKPIVSRGNEIFNTAARFSPAPPGLGPDAGARPSLPSVLLFAAAVDKKT